MTNISIASPSASPIGAEPQWMRCFRRAVSPLAFLALAAPAAAATDVADEPLLVTKNVAGNVALALSVEFPTAISVAHLGDYVVTNTYIGYFDPAKCYNYVFTEAEAGRHFAPAGLTTNHQCTEKKWSGNFLNWATTQTIDPFRWVLTGGYRVVDSATETILEKATASGQGSNAGKDNFPDRTLSNGVVAATGTGLAPFKMRIAGLGNKMRFTQSGNVNAATATPFNPGADVDAATVYEVSVRVKVCDQSAAAGGVEVFNCVRYPSGNFKPEGLIQRFSNKLRLSAFGYLNDPDLLRDGGVLRARQKFVGPTQPVPGRADVLNAAAEWNATTGVFFNNPDRGDATATSGAFGTAISNSGVINYLNKFGQLGISPLAQTYKTNDPVSELYYAAVRYFKRQGNVPEWTALNGKVGATLADGFPVITEYDDPIQFSCQKNFILGIGDVNSHADRNLPCASGGSEPGKPAAVLADTTVNVVNATNLIAQREGLSAALGLTSPYNGCCDNNGALIAGLAYDSHVRDIRTDIADKQTISTFWMDVLEFQQFKNDNQYYLAAKYGGFTVPESFDANATTPLPNELWHTNNQTLGRNLIPDNYFVASNPDQVVSGLTTAFGNIAGQLNAFASALGLPQPQISPNGSANYSVSFNWGLREGEVAAETVRIDARTNAITRTAAWKFTERLAAQLAGTSGFDTQRRVVTFDPDRKAGVPFRAGTLTADQLAALDTPYRTDNDAATYLNYLRGDSSQEAGKPNVDRNQAYRPRRVLVGDIVGSRATVVNPPNFPFSDASNPGYSAFRRAKANRQVSVYYGGNDGMLHGLNGSLSGAGSGQELFAFVPNALFEGPDGTPAQNGLTALGNPNFAAFGEYFFVNATPLNFDIDFNRTAGASGAPDWHSILIGGLGKGGRSYYAIDITDPAALGLNEASAASKVLWEFTDPDLGFSFGEPALVKTAKYGWVLILTSGYNNARGGGYFYFVNPRNGELLEKLATGAGTATNPAGLAHVETFVLDVTDGRADAAYAGDLLGNLWRIDLRPSTGAYAAPTLIAKLTNSDGVAQPVTTRPRIEVEPSSNLRYVLVGTGQFLGDTDLGSRQKQSAYSIIDGNASAFSTAAAVPYPFTRDDFVKNTNLIAGVVRNPATNVGWLIDLEAPVDTAGARVVIDPSTFNGIVTFVTTLPNNDPCQPLGDGNKISVTFGTGKTVLTNAAGELVPSIKLSGGVPTNNVVLSVGGKAKGCVGLSDGTFECDEPPVPPLPLKRINWRELPTVQ